MLSIITIVLTIIVGFVTVPHLAMGRVMVMVMVVVKK